MGIRPEHLKDAALVTDREAHGHTFTATIEVLESVGSDLYAYFNIPGAKATARELEEIAADTGAAEAPGATDQITARLDPASTAQEGHRLNLWFDPHKIHLFDAETGAHLTL
jgi:multiple sugar transport system ATP-binding protein